jgi:hypothetical protein
MEGVGVGGLGSIDLINDNGCSKHSVRYEHTGWVDMDVCVCVCVYVCVCVCVCVCVFNLQLLSATLAAA